MIPSSLAIVYEIMKKEFLEHLKTKRLVIFAVIFAVVFVLLAVYGNIIMGGTDTTYTWEEGPNKTISTVMAFANFLPAIMSIAMTYNTVSGERSQKSLILILSKPVDRVSVFLGKFLSAFLSIGLVYVIVMLVGYGVAAGLYGGSVSGGDVANMLWGIGIVLLGISVWISLTLMFSTVLKNPTTCIVMMVILWLFVLPLISQAGLIAFAIGSQNKVEGKPINVETSIVTTTALPPHNDLIFNITRMNRPVPGVNITLVNETGDTYLKKLSLSGTQTIFIDVPYGRYTWKAELERDKEEDAPKILDEGIIFVDGTHMILTNLTASKDSHYDDYGLMVVNDTGLEPNATVTLRDRNGVPVKGSGLFGIYRFENLKEGRYEIEVVIDNETIFKERVYSYGSFEPKDFFAILTGEQEEFPNYVSYTFAINPDNNMDVARQVVEGEDENEGSSMNIRLLTVNEGIAALCVQFALTFSIGLIVFNRMDPN